MDNSKDEFSQFGYPHIINVNGRVLFAGIAGKKTESTEVGTLVRLV